jgi:hypothetical protein
VQCIDVTDRLLADDLEHDPVLRRHLDDCAVCAHVARGLQRVDDVLASTLLIAPPLDLQRQLAQLALEAARPESVPWWRRLGELNLTEWVGRPQMVAAQGLAAVMLALASWQVFGVLSAFQPVVGDVGYAVAQVAGSPAAGYLNGLPVDLQSLGLWSLVGIGGWLVSENGYIGRRLNSSRQQQP